MEKESGTVGGGTPRAEEGRCRGGERGVIPFSKYH